MKWTKRPIVPDYTKSRFDVAIEVIAYLDQWFAIFAMLHFVRLQNDVRWTEIFAPWRQTCTGGQEKTDVAFDLWQRERLVVKLNGDSSCTRVLAGADGVLTIPVMYTEASPPETTELKNRISATYMSAFHRCMREGLSKLPKLLQYQHHTVAIVSGDTKVSDIVLPLLSIRFGNSPILILRRSERAFHIIGQGYILPGFRVSNTDKRKHNLSQLTSAERDFVFRAKVRLNLDAGDVMRLAGQDLVDVEGSLWSIDDRMRNLGQERPLGTATVKVVEEKQPEKEEMRVRLHQ